MQDRVGVVQLQGKEGQVLPASTRSSEEAKTDSLQSLQKKPTLPTPWFQTSGNGERIHLLFQASQFVVICYSSPRTLRRTLFKAGIAGLDVLKMGRGKKSNMDWFELIIIHVYMNSSRNYKWLGKSTQAMCELSPYYVLSTMLGGQTIISSPALRKLMV